jgi:hypothetical protein
MRRARAKRRRWKYVVIVEYGIVWPRTGPLAEKRIKVHRR